MGDNNAKETTAEKKKSKKDTTTTEDVSLTPHEHAQREKKKSRWTLDLCKKTASRYTSREEWKAGAPSSYKAAVARGWETECLKGLKKADGKTTSTPARKTPTRAA